MPGIDPATCDRSKVGPKVSGSYLIVSILIEGQDKENLSGFVRANMSLTFRSGAIGVAFGTVSFFMADNDKTVRVDVSQDALAMISGTPPKTKAGFAQLLAEHRRHFEQIAAFKYDEGDYRPEVRVLVVNVTRLDLR